MSFEIPYLIVKTNFLVHAHFIVHVFKFAATWVDELS